MHDVILALEGKGVDYASWLFLAKKIRSIIAVTQGSYLFKTFQKQNEGRGERKWPTLAMFDTELQIRAEEKTKCV